MFETIVALATPASKSALAIIRLSGDDCFQIVSKVFTEDLNNEKKRSIHFGYIQNNQKKIDQVVLLTYISPHSFTGENSVEIICHGSMVIVNEIIGVLLEKGCRMATNGEFSSRAYLHGKIDLIQAEAINDMINAETQESKDMMLYSLSGQTSNLFRPIKEKLGELLSKIEVNIDYPEYEDIEQISRNEIHKTCTEIINETQFLVDDGEKNKILHQGVKVAIVGQPNVGKSSLLNALIHEDKAIVTEIAGTTRDIVEGDFSLDGVPMHLYDTAGMHESDNKIEQIGISKAKKTIDNADLILYVIDNRGIDTNLFDTIKDKKYLIVQNKNDLFKFDNHDYISISAKNNEISQLLTAIKNILKIDEITIKPSFTNLRQLGLLKNIIENVKVALDDTTNNEPIDLISASLILAYNSSLELIGECNKNDLTDEIFSRFCVGK